MDARYDLFKRCYTEAVSARREQTRMPSPFFTQGWFEDPWPVYQEFYDGDHWSRMGALPTWKSRPVDNKCFAAVESYTTQLTDSKPRAAFQPRETTDGPLSDVVQGYYDYWWQVAEGQRAVYLAVKDSRKFGVGWLQLEWDKAKKRQCIYAVHPEAVLVDPDCTADNFDPTYLIYEYVAQVGELKAAFPKAEWDEFKSEADVSLSAGLMDRILKRIGIGNTDVTNPAKSVVVYEFFLRDPERIEWDVYDDELNIHIKKRKAKYKNGRVITIAGGIILDDRESEYKHGMPTLIPIHAYPETGKFYCASDISNILPAQVLLNRVNQMLMDGTLKNSGGIYLVAPHTGLTKKSITNDPVQVREVKDVNNALNVVQPPSPPRHLFDFGSYLSKIADDAVGIHDISRGSFTPGNKTAVEVDVMAESDRTRVRMAARNLSLALTRMGTMWLSNVAQFEDETRIVRIAGEEGIVEGVEFTGKLLRAEGGDDEWTLTPLDIIIDDASTLPARQRDREQLAMELHERGVIDSEELLTVVGWPNAKAVLTRMMPPPAPDGGPPPEGMPPEGMPPEGMPPPDMMPTPEMPPEGGVPVPADMPPELMAMLAAMQGGGQLPPQAMPEEGEMPPEMLAALMGGQM